jgi:hypothetical protein
MAEKHKYCNEILFTAKSGETGEPKQEIIFRQYYTDVASQVEEQQRMVPAVIAALTGVSLESAEKNVQGLAEKQNRRAR